MPGAPAAATSFVSAFRRVGGPLTRALWHGVGLAIVVGFLHDYHWPFRTDFRSAPLQWESYQRYLWARPAPDHAFSWSGIALALLGPRPALIAVSGVAALASWWVNASDPALFPSAELPLFVFLPLFTCPWLYVHRRRSGTAVPAADARPRCLDDDVAALFRAALVSTLGFAAFHKLNSDFFNPDTTCVTTVTGWFEEYWGAWGAPLRHLGSPALTVFCEAALPLLLVLVPPMGVIGTSLFFLPLGLVNATRIVVVTIVMSWAFLAPGDVATLLRRRRGLALATVAVGLPVVVGSLSVYPSRELSREVIALIEFVAVGSVLAGGLALLERFRRWWSPTLEASLPGTEGNRRVQPRSTAPRVLTALAVGTFVLNGISPYLGFKYNYSFAMWSNLRADGDRWNSYLVPAWVQIVPALERFVDVQQVEMATQRQPLLPAGPIEQRRFLRGMQRIRDFGNVRVAIAFRHRDREYAAADAFADPDIAALLAQLEADLAAPTPPNEDAVIIRHAETRTAAPYDRPYARRIEPALFSGARFHKLSRAEIEHGWTMDVRLRSGGAHHHFADAAVDPAFDVFLRTLPQDNLFPAKLDRSKPQRCFH